MPRDLRMLGYKIQRMIKKNDPKELLEFVQEDVLDQDGEIKQWLERNPEAVDELNNMYSKAIFELMGEPARFPLMRIDPQGRLSVRETLLEALERNVAELEERQELKEETGAEVVSLDEFRASRDRQGEEDVEINPRSGREKILSRLKRAMNNR